MVSGEDFPHGKILWPRILGSLRRKSMENFSEGEQEVFQEPYRIITDHYLFGCGSKWKTDVGPQM